MIVEYINTHQAEFWIIFGFILLSIEVATGIVTGLLLFSGIGSLLTGLLMLAGILNETWATGVSSTAICAILATALLWKPLQNLQNSDIPDKDNSSDLVGFEFTLEQDINSLTTGKTRYSGIEWKVEIDSEAGVEQISAGTKVSVCSVDVGKFRVKPV